MTSTKATIISTAAFVAFGLAHAEQPTTEWRVLGPAFAHHFSTDGQITKAANTKQECRDGFANLPASEPIVSPTPLAGPFFAMGRDAQGNYIYMPTGLSMHECKQVLVPAENQGWEDNNPALGIQLTQRYDDHSNVFLANWVRDSYGTQSFMLAAGRMWPFLTLGSVKFDGGLVGGLWYRSLLNKAEDGVVRRVVPFALPSIAVSDNYTGLGIELGFAPKLAMNGYVVNRTPTLMVQTTYLVRDSMRGWTAFKFGTSEQGGVTASVNFTY